MNSDRYSAHREERPGRQHLDAKITLILKIAAVCVVAVLGAGAFYYVKGRKPKVAATASVPANARLTRLHVAAPDEVLMLADFRLTSSNPAKKTTRWTVDLPSEPLVEITDGAPQPVSVFFSPLMQKQAKLNAEAAAAVKLEQVKALVPKFLALQTEFTKAGKDARKEAAQKRQSQEELQRARLDGAAARLTKWATALQSRRATLKDPKAIVDFNAEAARYQAELGRVRKEMAELTAKTAAAKTAPPPKPPPDEDMMLKNASEIFVQGNAVWLVIGPKVMKVDRGSGQLLKEVGLPGVVRSASLSATHFYATCSETEDTLSIARINLQNNEFDLTKITDYELRSTARGADGAAQKPVLREMRGDAAFGGPGVVRMSCKLITERIVTQNRLKTTSDEDWAKLEESPLSTGPEAVESLLKAVTNDAERDTHGDTIYVDNSDYEIELFRENGSKAPSLKLQGAGYPMLYATEHHVFVAFGKKLIALDHENQKLWEINLAGTIPQFGAVEDLYIPFSQPIQESGDRIYFFDDAMLTACDRKSGNVLWRLPSSGTLQVAEDSKGMLYVLNTGEGYRKVADGVQSSLCDSSAFKLSKVEPQTGKVLWMQPKYQAFFLNGDGIYATREVANANDFTNAVFATGGIPETRFRLCRLNRGSGKAEWDWYQTRRPVAIAGHGSTVSILYREKLETLVSFLLFP